MLFVLLLIFILIVFCFLLELKGLLFELVNLFSLFPSFFKKLEFEKFPRVVK